MTEAAHSTRPTSRGLDPQSREPLHAQLARYLRDQIRDRDLLPGEVLPTEAHLQEKYGVSRSVARQAMATLVTEGLVVRGRGRGSVVAPERQRHRIVNDSSGLYAQMREAGSELRTDILSMSTEVAPRPIPELGGQLAVRLERLRSLDGTPTAFIRTWLPTALAGELTADDLRDASLHAVLSDRFGLRIAGGRRTVRAVAADLTLAGLLGVHTGAPLLLLEGVTESEDGRFIEHFATWHRGDLIAFDLDARRGMSSDGASDARLAEARALIQRAAEVLDDRV
ncbi:GntR family transcriptional regulator [Microcella putealis]|uniref:GntR family transcriptional regulator n=1 Tax=Microcella putealis TaxID=337005 RepID=A0A4Q7LVI6_9MICO|nr:GntR family transcriptional regulator [Microcella putealis]RZS59105.1 GntR family transcriptional regulator [Microcella putealis]TQM24131.1 GntR family transcriptional regulator [Microcella putealis]